MLSLWCSLAFITTPLCAAGGSKSNFPPTLPNPSVTWLAGWLDIPLRKPHPFPPGLSPRRMMTAP